MATIRNVFQRLRSALEAGAMPPTEVVNAAARGMQVAALNDDEKLFIDDLVKTARDLETERYRQAVKVRHNHYIGPGPNAPTHVYGVPLNAQANPVAPTPKPDAYQMIAMRMRWFQHPFTKMHITNTEAGNYLVLVVIGEQHAVLEDDQAMFPSDALVNKLRMMTP